MNREENNIQNNTDEPQENIIREDEQDNEQDFVEELDTPTWTATGLMAKLPMEVYFGNALEPAARSQILQAKPQNRGSNQNRLSDL